MKRTIRGIASIAVCYKPGLQALGKHRAKVIPEDTKRLRGSVDLDTCLAHTHPHDSRWDYIIGYDGKYYFAEVHPARVGEIPVVLKKLDWLRGWLQSNCPVLLSRQAENAYHWIFTKNNPLPPGNNRYTRQLINAGIQPPKRVLKLP